MPELSLETRKWLNNMEVKFKKITIKDLFNGYTDNNELGVRAYSGTLNVRPPYQREFIYKEKQRDLVIDSILKGFPLNLMYWAVRDDGSFEIIDGQQRTVSICQYIKGVFSIEGKYFHSQLSDKQKIILDYELMVYLCSGTPTERLEWFRTINIAGEKLTEQELRNAVYSGSWVTSAKQYFSKSGCAAYSIGNKYLDGTPIRQDYLETVLKWITKGDIDSYMSKHQHDTNAKPLIDYFNEVLEWVNKTFTTYYKEMKGIQWGDFYNVYKTKKLPSADNLEKQIKKLMSDDEVTNPKGIFAYLLTKDEKHLNIREFPDRIKRDTYIKQDGICKECKDKFDQVAMEADHIKPWSQGGRTIPKNCQMLCKQCNRIKSKN